MRVMGAAAQLVGFVWRVIRAWWERHGLLVHPDPSGGTDARYILDYTWADLGRDLRRIGARLMSLIRHPGL
ncbi:MAG: hypothetical protein M3Q29_05510 [Chloroflexota bacterium]|nr:hypothetical protein [Chloroflexota bacterium]